VEASRRNWQARPPGRPSLRGLWRHKERPREPRLVTNPRRQELETAKEILAEAFGAQPFDVEVMIR
jgi:hypothetical protein